MKILVFHTKNILKPEIYRYKNNNISNQKKSKQPPNLQFAGDVKFAGDNLIDPLKPKNITLKINENPSFIGEIVSNNNISSKRQKFDFKCHNMFRFGIKMP